MLGQNRGSGFDVWLSCIVYTDAVPDCANTSDDNNTQALVSIS